MPLSGPLRAAVETADLSRLQSTVLELCSKDGKVNRLFSEALLPSAPTEASIKEEEVEEASLYTIKQEPSASPAPSMQAEAGSHMATSEEVAASNMHIKQDRASPAPSMQAETGSPMAVTQEQAGSNMHIKQDRASPMATLEEVAASNIPIKQERADSIPLAQAPAAASAVPIKQEPANANPNKRKAIPGPTRLVMCTRQNCHTAFNLDNNPRTGCLYHIGSLKADPSLTEFAPKSFPEAMRLMARFWWTCCGAAGDADEGEACMRGPHQVFGKRGEGEEEVVVSGEGRREEKRVREHCHDENWFGAARVDHREESPADRMEE